MEDHIERDVVLMIADISGYTKFLVTNRMELDHAQIIIIELIQTIINEVKIPLKISKLEGDAVFFFAVKDGDSSQWEGTRRHIGRKLLFFFEKFSDKLYELKESNTCECSVCSNVDVLNLKVIVHSGRALFYRLDRFTELSGIDVIIAHRLLKNTLKSDSYILMTEQAHRDIPIPQDLAVKKHREEYETIGNINSVIFYPHTADDYFHNYSSLSIKAKYMIKKMLTPLLFRMKLRKSPVFTNLPDVTP
ncbi:MAG: DUF2652 domain-containing protein [Deltaproteobacteria bacterium]|nr:DUF2652 domain-containing protein [Candidatus Zymogenaceae bacterium]